jgi:hypothetical protein
VGVERLERPCVYALVDVLCCSAIGGRMPDEPAVQNLQTPWEHTLLVRLCKHATLKLYANQEDTWNLITGSVPLKYDRQADKSTRPMRNTMADEEPLKDPKTDAASHYCIILHFQPKLDN